MYRSNKNSMFSHKKLYQQSLRNSAAAAARRTSSSPSPWSPPPSLKKKVTFNKLIHAVLIPCINDYIEAGLIASLWSSKEEMKEYKREAANELKQMFALRQPGEKLSLRQAINELYELNPAAEESINTSYNAGN